MLSHVPILLIQHVQRLAVEHQVFIVDFVWQLPALGMEIGFPVIRGGRGGVHVRDEVVLPVRRRLGRHFNKPEPEPDFRKSIKIFECRGIGL